jgi:hypothetical protein
MAEFIEVMRVLSGVVLKGWRKHKAVRRSAESDVKPGAVPRSRSGDRDAFRFLSVYGFELGIIDLLGQALKDQLAIL